MKNENIVKVSGNWCEVYDHTNHVFRTVDHTTWMLYECKHEGSTLIEELTYHINYMHELDTMDSLSVY